MLNNKCVHLSSRALFCAVNEGYVGTVKLLLKIVNTSHQPEVINATNFNGQVREFLNL